MSARPVDPDLARRIAAAFGTGNPTLDRFARVAALTMALIVVGYGISVVIRVNWPGYGGDTIVIDFAAFWAAAKLALAGNPLAAFDPVVLDAVMAAPSDSGEGNMLWLYPPAWHIVITPFGLLPFSAAFILYSIIAYLVFAAAVRPLAAPLPAGLPMMLAGPAIVLILQFGNMSLLWTAGLITALGALAQGREARAGGLIALLTLKPQLGLLIPVALLAGGHWRTIAYATGGALAIAGLSTAVMGVEYWLRWIDTLGFMSGLAQTDLVKFHLMITWYALVRYLGVPHEWALMGQLAVTLAAAVAVAWVWRRPVTTDLKAAVLCIAIPVATPYAWHYEMALALVGAMFLARDGFGRTTGARVVLGALWLGHVPGIALDPYLPPAFYVAPLLTATIGLCVWRAAAGAPAPSTLPGQEEADGLLPRTGEIIGGRGAGAAGP